MHHHGYLWTGPKSRFDDEALRRPSHPEPPPPGSPPELIRRYQEVADRFPVCELPPLETAYWLVKPVALVRETWPDADGAGGWLRGRLAAYAPRSVAEAQRGAGHLGRTVGSAVQRLRSGQDAVFGCYLERPVYLSLALVTCSPNRARPELPCPLDG